MSESNGVTGLMSVFEVASALAESVRSITGAQFAALDEIERAYREEIVEAICDGSLPAVMPDTLLPVRRDTPYTAGFAVVSLVERQAVDDWLSHIGSPVRLGSAEAKSDSSPERGVAPVVGNFEPMPKSFPTTPRTAEVIGPYWKPLAGNHESRESSLRNALSSCRPEEPGRKARSAYLLPSKKTRSDGAVGWDPVRLLVDAWSIGKITDPLGAADAIARAFPEFKVDALEAKRAWAPSYEEVEQRLPNYAFGAATAVPPQPDCS
jgi:hypothetical protein